MATKASKVAFLWRLHARLPVVHSCTRRGRAFMWLAMLGWNRCTARGAAWADFWRGLCYLPLETGRCRVHRLKGVPCPYC